jgi:hypothetical protein
MTMVRIGTLERNQLVYQTHFGLFQLIVITLEMEGRVCFALPGYRLVL